MKNFAIPQQVIDCLNQFAPADRGMAFTALFDYINKGLMPSDDISPAARGAFEFARLTIDPMLARRRRAAERRAARNNACTPGQACAENNAPAEASVVHAAVEEHTRVMRKVVELAYRTCSTHARRNEKIRSELERRFPGMYQDIIYDKNANVQLVAAV